MLHQKTKVLWAIPLDSTRSIQMLSPAKPWSFRAKSSLVHAPSGTTAQSIRCPGVALIQTQPMAAGWFSSLLLGDRCHCSFVYERQIALKLETRNSDREKIKKNVRDIADFFFCHQCPRNYSWKLSVNECTQQYRTGRGEHDGIFLFARSCLVRLV